MSKAIFAIFLLTLVALLATSCAHISEAMLSANEGYQRSLDRQEEYSAAIAELATEYDAVRGDISRGEALLEKYKAEGASLETVTATVAELATLTARASELKSKIEDGATAQVIKDDIAFWQKRKEELGETEGALPVWAQILLGILGSVAGVGSIALKKTATAKRLANENVEIMAKAIRAAEPAAGNQIIETVSAAMPPVNKKAFSRATKG